MVMPRSRSSGALSIWSKATKLARPLPASTRVIAAVSVVFPWSTWPIVPMLTCGLLRSNFSFDIVVLFLLRSDFRDDLFGDVPGHLLVGSELHRVIAAALGLGAQGRRIAEHFRERHP